MKRPNKIIFRMTLCAVFGALSFVVTAFLPIQYSGNGYFHFGDVFAILISMIFGPIEGFIVAIIGGVFSDLYLGYSAFIPFTLIAKALLTFVTGIMFKDIKINREKARKLVN